MTGDHRETWEGHQKKLRPYRLSRAFWERSLLAAFFIILSHFGPIKSHIPIRNGGSFPFMGNIFHGHGFPANDPIIPITELVGILAGIP